MSKPPTIIVCQSRPDQPIQPSLYEGLLGGLARWPQLEVEVLPHLYDLVPDGPSMQCLHQVQGDMIVLAALYPRAAFWVLDANRIQGHMGRTLFFPEEEMESPFQDDQDDRSATSRTIWCLDLRTHEEARPYLEEIQRIVASATGQSLEPTPAGEPLPGPPHHRIDDVPRHRWYPVIDRDRCGGCLECLNFCLFGVYGLDESGGPIVEEPDACRDGCPACARICSSGAIMFPGHADPVLAGKRNGRPGKAGQSGEQRAAAERRRALEEQSTPNRSKAGEEPSQDELDRLVDDVDGLDL